MSGEVVDFKEARTILANKRPKIERKKFRPPIIWIIAAQTFASIVLGTILYLILHKTCHVPGVITTMVVVAWTTFGSIIAYECVRSE